MKNFKDLGIPKSDKKYFSGDKISIKKIINKEIVVNDYKIEDSKFEGKGKCLHMHITHGEEKRVVFTSAKKLIDTVQLINKEDYPVKTTIAEVDGFLEFT